MIFNLDIHAEMTLRELATAIADTILHEQIAETVDNFQRGKFIPSPAYHSEDPWDAALWQMASWHLIKHQFIPVKTIITIMINHFIDDYRQLCPRAPIGDLSYLVADGEITKSYSALISEIKRVMLARYKVPESINTIEKGTS